MQQSAKLSITILGTWSIVGDKPTAMLGPRKRKEAAGKTRGWDTASGVDSGMVLHECLGTRQQAVGNHDPLFG
jgi:hypothetical protein